jgi:hypothetical protein
MKEVLKEFLALLNPDYSSLRALKTPPLGTTCTEMNTRPSLTTHQDKIKYKLLK